MRFIITITILVLSATASAQVHIEFAELLANSLSKPTEKSKLGKYKAQKIKGKLSGMGTVLLNNGSFYYGDLYEKQFHGYGTLISVDTISNCQGSSIYVGRFKNSLKNGHGRCYNIDGELLYEGLFKNDKPIDSYPTVSFQSGILPYFTEFTTDEYRFIGEFIGDKPHGPGIFIFSTGDLYITDLIDGSPNGISLLIQPDDNWISEKIENGISTPISSSTHYESLKENARENFRAGLSAAFSYFSQALHTGTQLATQIKNTSSRASIKVDQTYNANSLDNKSNIHDNDIHNTPTNRYNISEQQNYNRDKSTYHKYDGLLAKAFADNTYATESEKKEWQYKMKQLREKWEKRGRDFPHSPNEDR